MPKTAYIEKNFRARSLDLIYLANDIIGEYSSQGFDLTLRQLYYQMVARDIIPNSQKSYDNLGSLISDARLAGLIDWDAITDRTRNLRQNSHWSTPREIMASAAASFRMDRWRLQNHRPEVWVEKDALIGVIASVCEPLDVPYFACRGYTSQSEMWAAAQRIVEHIEDGYEPIIFHLGDHDPSGIDMSRDIQDRLNMFVEHDLGEIRLAPDWYYGEITFERLALNWSQVQQYNPPPNPAKMSDSRAEEYVINFGRSSWELDALSPTVIAGIITSAIEDITDEDNWKEAEQQENVHRQRLQKAAQHWQSLSTQLDQL